MYPKVNQNIHFTIKDRDETWRSIVAEIEEDEILITFPMDRTIFGFVQIGTSLEISYIYGESKYKFQTEIIGRKSENLILIRLKKPKEDEIIKIQDRENFRVNAHLPLILNEWKLSTINISAGGLLCSCSLNEEIVDGEEVSGTVYIPGTTDDEIIPIVFKAEVIRVQFLKDADRQHIALRFIEIDQRDQKKILQYCFEKQRQIRLKERGMKSNRS